MHIYSTTLWPHWPANIIFSFYHSYAAMTLVMNTNVFPFLGVDNTHVSFLTIFSLQKQSKNEKLKLIGGDTDEI